MGAGSIAKPGTKYGPCRKCEHTDCEATRRIAKAPCRICHEPIGYQRAYFQENTWTVFVHADCLEEEIETERVIKARTDPSFILANAERARDDLDNRMGR